jgi:hypothetical protein
MRRSLLVAAAALLATGACTGLTGLAGGGTSDTPTTDSSEAGADSTASEAGGDAITPPPPDPGSDASPPPIDAGVFQYRRRITIVNGATSPLPAGLTIRLSFAQTLAALVAQGKVKADFSDLRVIGDGALGERDRVVDPPTGPAPAALSFSLVSPIAAGTTSTDYAIYYGAPSVSAAPANGGKVFPLYDDFTSGISTVWMKSDGPTTANGKLVLRGGHLDGLTTVAASDGVPIVSAVELVANVINPNDDPTAQPQGTFFYWFGYQHAGDFDSSDPWALWVARDKGMIKSEQMSPVGCEKDCVGPNVPQTTAPRYYAIERDPTTTRFALDGTVYATPAVTNQTDYSVMVRNFLAATDVQIDWIRARARVSPDPVVTLGAEEKP